MQTAYNQYRHIFETAQGFCGVAWTDAGIARFQLPAPKASETERSLLRRAPDTRSADPSAEVATTITAIKQYFEGEQRDFSNVPLDLTGQDAFFTEVYTALRGVGWGSTTTYGALAKSLGKGPEAARDVGVAMSKNPVPLIIPCHRVLAAGGKVGGFSAPGGAASKVRMLALEGLRIGAPEPLQGVLAL